MKLLVVVVALIVAQVFSSCSGDGSSTVVVGWVEAKRVDRSVGYVIVIDHVDYEVPGPFWNEVRVGDLVKWDGKVWTIVRRASG